MNGYIGVTDAKWFEHLRALNAPEEINFWQPGGKVRFQQLVEGEPFFLRLKAPVNAIAGFGYFAGHSFLPIWLAWESFGENNGAGSLDELKKRIGRYLDKSGGNIATHQIGCIMLASPVFFPRNQWIPQPIDFPINQPSGMKYSLESGEGKRVWDACRERAAAQAGSMRVAEAPARKGEWPGYGAPQLVAPRKGQGIFRVAVTDAYGRACAMSHEHSLPVVEAAHIKPYSDHGPHSVANGIALRADIHRLFDQYYVTVTPDKIIRVSPRLYKDFGNGRHYKALDGQPITVPPNPRDHPGPEFLRWHNERFLT